ncbi:MAG: hypothetical protein AAFR58_16235 [Cyanobacteria bacterium J06627_28]
MLQAEQFDVKTGKPIQVLVEKRWQTAVKQIEHSYLEHWFQTNNIDPTGRFSVARFYESVTDTDRRQLELEGKYLVFSSESEGYFTDRETAELMVLGSDLVAPIYAADHNGAHNAVAYGGLIASDGVASTTLASARILVIDDDNRAHGNELLIDQEGRQVRPHHLAHLYDKMGDGTMLVSEGTMRSLQTDEEREEIWLQSAERATVTGDLTTLAQEWETSDAAYLASETKEVKLARQSVYQFRAATPELPGIAKGTVASSQWCDRLGVDAIISLNDIKGADQRFAKPGIQEVSNFWINRKATAKYGKQTVGPQLKNTIPRATWLEINPRVQAKAEALAKVAGDYDALSQYYLEQKDKERDRPTQDSETDTRVTDNSSWLYSALSSDTYGQLVDESHIVRGLERYIRGEWRRLASNGTSVPSAMAQHHSKLRPWEVCNKDLPHGALVAYYRSPFPNVGAAAIAVNNTEMLKQQDREAYRKQGVVYLPPSTAKNVAITDFDGDVNGFFVGYRATTDDLPQRLREELADVADLLPGQQYDAARDVFADMIDRFQRHEDAEIEPADYPMAVAEFIHRTAENIRPLQVIKQKKEKHSWQDGESHAQATWRAWAITADNPTGKVANACMSLQALANELEYVPSEKQEALLVQVSKHFSQLLTKAELPDTARGKLHIPSDEWLSSQGFSGSYKEKIAQIAGVAGQLDQYTEPGQREHFISETLWQASLFLSEVANGPGSVNLQTAVDTAKSARGINNDVHSFMQALRYKRDLFGQNKKNAAVYTRGDDGPRKMPTSLSEPVSWGVERVNEQYAGAVLEERRNINFQGIFPKFQEPQKRLQTQAIVDTFSRLTGQAQDNKSRHRQRRSADQRPTVQAFSQDGKVLSFHSIPDAQGRFPWRQEGPQPDWSIQITHNPKARTLDRRFSAALKFVDSQDNTQVEPMGYLDRATVESSNLEQRFQQTNSLTVSGPHLTMQVPWAQQNDSEMLFAERDRYLENALAPPDEKEPQVHAQEMATALWWLSQGGRKVVMQRYPAELSARLAERPKEIVVGRLQISAEQMQRLVDKSPHTIQFHKDIFPSKDVPVVVPSVSVLNKTGKRFLIGGVATGAISLPKGATYMAAFSMDAKSQKIVRMQLMDLPVVEQLAADLMALQEGRQYLMLDHELHDLYGIREGSVVVVQAEPGANQVALMVGKQHHVNESAIVSGLPGWTGGQKPTPRALFESLLVARNRGKELWVVEAQPLGRYERERIQPFEVSVLGQVDRHAAETRPQPVAAVQAIEASETGVLAVVSEREPKIKQRLEQVAEAGEKHAIAAESPHSTSVDKPAKATANKPPAHRSSQRQKPLAKKQARDRGMSY